MNLAIAITSSAYKHPLIHLPACKRDAEIISALLDFDTSYDDKLILNDIPASAEVKKKLSEFIARHKGTEVDTLFFYFSGHGDFTGEEFYYLLSDFTQSQRRQTSLENSEIDNLLRSLNPKLTVKVIDACHSGVPYIKDGDAFGTYLKGTKETFNKCYFMFSSQIDQSSYQNNDFSFFTRSLGEAILRHPSESIRVKDIIDYVSDAFSGNSLQTPFFVIQADFTELFCGISEDFRTRLGTVLSGANSPISNSPHSHARTINLKDLVATEAMEFCTEDEAAAILDRLRTTIFKLSKNAEGEEVYDVNCVDGKEYSELPGHISIAQWLDNNKHDLFVRVLAKHHHKETDPLIEGISARAIGPFYGLGPREVVRTITGFASRVALPYNFIAVNAMPKFANIESTTCLIVPLISETELRLFVGFGQYEKIGWKERVLSGSVSWKTKSVKLRDEAAASEYLHRQLDEFWVFTLNPLKKRFGLIKEESSEQGGEQSEKAESQATKT